MPYTFDPSLPSDRDFVRLLIGDTVENRMVFDDETITAMLAEEANKYLAAARLGDSLVSRWQSLAGGVVEKIVGNLRIRWADAASAQSAYSARMKELRERGYELELRSTGRPATFRVL